MISMPLGVGDTQRNKYEMEITSFLKADVNSSFHFVPPRNFLKHNFVSIISGFSYFRVYVVRISHKIVSVSE